MFGDNIEIRKRWGIGSKVEVFSNSTRTWCVGTIKNVKHDFEGEWLIVKYGNNKQKEIQRMNKNIKEVTLMWCLSEEKKS